jgi:hypothetical protein
METNNGFNFQITKKGAKVTNAIEPGITLVPTYNKFELNSLASKLIGLSTKDTVNLGADEDSTDINNMFYICKGVDNNGAILASHNQEEGVGRQLGFTYADIYSRILLNALLEKGDSAINIPVDSKGTAVSVSKLRLTQMGLLKGGSCVKKVYAKIEVGPTKVINGEEVQLYRLYDFMITDHKPREVSPRKSKVAED